MNLLTSSTLWIIFALVAAVVVVSVYMSSSERPGGFKDVLKNPQEYQEALDTADRDYQRALSEARKFTDQELAALVRHFVLEVRSSREADIDKRLLVALALRTQTAVIDLLGDSTLREQLVIPTGENFLPEAPFNRACMLLEGNTPAACIPVVAPFLDLERKEIKKSAALILGESGHADAAPQLRKALADPDEYVRSYALIGLERARERCGLSNECATALFPDIQRLVAEGKNADDATKLLLKLDRDKASSFMLSEAIFSPRYRELHHVLAALTQESVNVPRQGILDLIEPLRAQELQYPETYLLGELLHALGKHRDPADRPLFESMLSHPEERVGEGAAAGLLNSHGMGDFEKRIWQREEQSGAESLTQQQRYYSAIIACDAEIKNGGLSQYFFNSSGNTWKDALNGFEVMGLTEHAQILRQAVAVFGSTGPDTDRDRRMDQLSRISRKNETSFDALDTRYFASKENICAQGARYVIQNAEAFK
jgi:HEAT repeat protein